MGKRTRKTMPYRWALWITLWTFLLAVLIALASQVLTDWIQSLFLSFLVLAAIILVGVLADIVGIAATAAEEKPFHAKAAKKVPGAREAIFFVRNAGMVSNFANDVIGDISGIVSGSLGALVVFQLKARYPGMNLVTWSIILTAVIAAVTVGGKALGKGLALARPTEVLLLVSRIIQRFKSFLGR
jgi:hypothetical protein